MKNNRLNSIGLGALVTSAVIATGTFGDTMVQHPTVTQGLTSPTLASTDDAEPRVKRVGDFAVIAAPLNSALDESPRLESSPELPLQGATGPNEQEPVNPAVTASNSEAVTSNSEAATSNSEAAVDAPIEGVSPTDDDIVVIEINPTPDSAPTAVPVPAGGLLLSPSDEPSVGGASIDSSATDDLPEEGELSALSLPQLAPTTAPTEPSETTADTDNGATNNAADTDNGATNNAAQAAAAAAAADDDNQPRRNDDERRRSRQGDGNRRDQGGPTRQRG